MSNPELEHVIQHYNAYHTYQSHIDPIMSAPSSSPSSSPPGTPEEHRALLTTQSADHTQLGPPDVAANYGTLDSEADIHVDEADEESRRSHEDEQRQPKDAAMTEDLATKEARRNVMKASPILATGILLVAIDTSVVTANYALIGSDLGALNLVSWIATAYFLATASSQPLYGKFSDIFGRKPCLLFSYTTFLIGVLMCGFARSMGEFIAARVVQGIGGGGILILISIIFSDVVPMKERGLWQGGLNILYTIGMSIGAPLGGGLAEAVGWRWIFIGQAPICLFAIIAITFILHLPPPPASKTPKTAAESRSKLLEIDYLGGALLILTITSFLVGLDIGSNNAWDLPACYIPLAASPVVLGLFIFVEKKYASQPFIPGHVLFSRPLIPVYTWNFFSTSAIFSIMFYFPLVYQAVMKFNAGQAGALLLPGVIAGTIGNFTAGMIVKRTGRYYWPAVLASGTMVLGFLPVIVSVRPEILSVVGMVMGNMVVGFFQGTNVTFRMIALLNNVSTTDQAIALSCFYTFGQLGSAIGTSITGTIIQNVLRIRLGALFKDDPAGDDIARGARDSLDFIDHLAPALQATVRRIYAEAAGQAFYFILGGLGLGFCCALFIREKALKA